MRCRGVVLIASRISVPSPATPCTLITPNGAPHGLHRLYAIKEGKGGLILQLEHRVRCSLRRGLW